MQNSLIKIKPGNLIQTKQSPLAHSNGYYFFCEQDGMTHEISHGTIGLIINIDRVSAIGDPIVDILFSDENKILSTAHYDDQHGNPLWCNILQ
jgi:hypothetical protein